MCLEQSKITKTEKRRTASFGNYEYPSTWINTEFGKAKATVATSRSRDLWDSSVVLVGAGLKLPQ